ncbi:MAG: hypothetical protein R2911_29300 [Caldilineaceae bacterium]
MTRADIDNRTVLGDEPHAQSSGADAANAAPYFLLPLQQVWPVQQAALAAPAVAHAANGIGHGERPEDAPCSSVTAGEERAALQRRVQDIPASQASDSRIDAITPPRRCARYAGSRF